MNNSRTYNSIKNSIVAMGFYVVNLVLQFFSRKIFLDYLGTEILGLNTTATNLLQFLNLAELGISNAVAFSLYKPLHINDIESINEIITFQGYVYRRIAILILLLSVALMGFFPMIFGKMELPLWYAYMSFGVLLLSSLLGYFVNYRQILLSASQQDYKILYGYKSMMLLKVCVQMAAVKYLNNGYVWWAVLEALFAVIGAVTLHIVTMRSFPMLRKSELPLRILRRKYDYLELKIKQLFFHKIGTFALTQTSPFIIYAFANLTLVTLYGNYMMVILGVQLLMISLFNGLNAGIGDLVAEGDDGKIADTFSALFSIRFIFAATLSFVVFKFTPLFINLWIGETYLLPVSTLFILCITLFIQTFRPAVEAFTSAYGLYGDIYAPIVEVGLNIGLSVLLGKYFGLNGILTGVLVSLVAVVMIWKPYYLISRCLPMSLKRYLGLFALHLFILVPSIAIVYLVSSWICVLPGTWTGLVADCVIYGILFIIPSLLLAIVFNHSFRDRIRIITKNITSKI